MRRTKEHAQKTRATILSSALDVFWENGYSQTSLDAVCMRAGVTRGALYWHFPGGKPELLNALLRERSQPAEPLLTFLREGPDSPEHRLTEVMRGWFVAIETQADYRKIMELTLFKIERRPELEDGITEKLKALRDLQDAFAAAVRAGITEGAFRSDVCPTSAGLHALSLLLGCIQLWLFAPQQFPLVAEGERLIEFFLASIKRIDAREAP